MIKSNESLTMKTFIMISLFLCINCQNSSGRIFGIGVGTFIIIIAVVFSVLWCLLCRSSSNPEIYSIIGLIVPIILIIIFIFMPKEVNRPPTTAITDSNFIPHIVFMVISIIGLLLALFFIMINEIFVFRKAKNIARAAFIMKE